MELTDNPSVEARIILLLSGLTFREYAKAVLSATTAMLDLEEDAATEADANQLVAEMVLKEIAGIQAKKADPAGAK